MTEMKKTDRSLYKHRSAGTAAALVCCGLLLTTLLGACGKAASGQAASAADTAAGAVTAESPAAAQTASTAAQAAQTALTGDQAAQTGETAAEASASAAAAATASAAGAATAETAAQDAPFSAEGKGLVIVLDPGHSSQVPGTTEPVGPGSTEMKDADTVGTYGPSSTLHEYDLTMKVSQKLRAELEDRGYTVKLTHFDTVRPIGCVDRAGVANENKADAFIRIHANGSTNTEANGAMTICISEDNPYHPELYAASSRLSEVILDAYCEQTGIRREYVWETDTMTGNNWAEMPTTLIELGYMTNPDEDLEMAQDSQQKRMAIAIADGLDRWFAEMPEEELSMHPALTGEAPSAGEGASGTTAEAAAQEGETGSTAEAAAQEGAAGSTAETEKAEGQETGSADADASAAENTP